MLQLGIGQVLEVKESDGIPVQDFFYLGPQGSRVTATMTLPKKSGYFPAAIFLHSASGNRDVFFQDAIRLSKNGFVCLLIDAPWARPGFHRANGLLEPVMERDLFIQTVGEVRKGVDLLCDNPCVDYTRIGFVGRNLGAVLGASLAAVEKRFTAFVLQAGIPSLTEFWMRSPHPVAQKAREGVPFTQFAVYEGLLKPFDPLQFIPQAQVPLLFQYGSEDDWIQRSVVEDYFERAPNPKTIKWYDTGHDMDCVQAAHDYQSWLLSQSGVSTVHIPQAHDKFLF